MVLSTNGRLLTQIEERDMYKYLTLATIAMLVSTGTAADAVFPSSQPPAGKSPSEVKQFVTFLWDDNAYSGLAGTLYEDETGKQIAVKQSEEATWGMGWAVRKLAGERTNPDGSPITMTFNVTTGQMIPVAYDEAIGDYTGYKGERYQTESWETGELGDFAVVWGREQPCSPPAPWHTDGVDDPIVEGAINLMYKEALLAGHEIGNHTIDHMETNSPLPLSHWPNGGEGFDTDPNEGESSAKPSWETMGWLMKAGTLLSQQGWSDALSLAEDNLQEYLNVSIDNGNLSAFRAPRLEVNSGLFFALAEKGYLYDCSLEEGYESHRDGTNFLWPYTLDNGSPNVWTQKSWGSPKPCDSMPAGLWQYPVNVVIVPDNIRPDVIQYAKKIATAQGQETGHFDSWNGKITNFDFNTFIYWGMTGEQVQQTLQHTLDLRMDVDNGGNRSPMQIGCHTDYFSPIYDNATLRTDDVFKLALERNVYTDRIAAYENFADYALNKGAYIISGKAVIDSVIALGTANPGALNQFSATNPSWEFQEDEVGSTTESTAPITGNLTDVQINMKERQVVGEDWDNGKYPGASYATWFNAGTIKELTHIQLTYQTNAPLMVRLHVADTADGPREILLNNSGPTVVSGKIPFSAFEYSQYFDKTPKQLVATDIIGIEIAPQVVGKAEESVTFTVEDIEIYGLMNETSIHSTTQSFNQHFGLNGISNGALNLSVPSSGRYDVNFFSLNGRLVQSHNNRELSSGMNHLGLNNLATGVYMIRVTGIEHSDSFTSTLFVE